MIYADLSTIGKIAYSRYQAWGLTTTQLSKLVTDGKITVSEKEFIIGV